MLLAVVSSLGTVPPITTSGNWGSDSVGLPGPVASLAITLTVPAGNPGVVTLTASNTTTNYKKGAGSFTSFTTSDVTFANGDTLQFNFVRPAGGITTVTAIDKATGTVLGGGWAGSII